MLHAPQHYICLTTHAYGKPAGLRYFGQFVHSPTITLHTHEDLLALPEPHEQLQDTWEEGNLVLVFGEGGSFKSAVVLSTALALATARPWHGKAVASLSGPILWVAGEGFRNFRKRVEAWRIREGVPSPFTPNQLVACGEPLPLLTENDRYSAMLGAFSAVKPSIVVLDTLADCMGAAGLSDARQDEMQRSVAAIKHLMLTLQCTAIVIHHTGWSAKERPRGSTALYFASDSALRCYTSKKEPFLVRIVNTRQRDLARWEGELTLPVDIIPTPSPERPHTTSIAVATGARRLGGAGGAALKRAARLAMYGDKS